MAEPAVERIIEPSLLCNLSSRMSNLGLDCPPSSQTSPSRTRIELAIFQPLTNPEMLAACRKREAPIVHGDGNRPIAAVKERNYPEGLKLRELGRAWGSALASIDPLRDVVFDLTLPKTPPGSDGSQDDTAHQIYWMHKTPETSCLFLDPHGVIKLITTLATALRMRSDGDVRLDIKYVEGEADIHMTKLLRRQLFALAECISSMGHGERGYQVL